MPPVTFPVILSRQDGSVVLDGDLTAIGGLPPSEPAWFQSGVGDPVAGNPTVPNTVGGLYFDTSGDTGLWTAVGATSADWAALGNAAFHDAAGLVYTLGGAGEVTVVVQAQGAGTTSSIAAQDGSAVIATTGEVDTVLADGTTFSVLSGAALAIPQHVTAGGPAYVEGGMYYDTTLHKLMIGGAAGWETVTSV